MSVYECPKCGSPDVIEHLYSCYAKRELEIDINGGYNINDEYIASAENSDISYTCILCGHKYEATNVEDLVLEMEKEEEE